MKKKLIIVSRKLNRDDIDTEFSPIGFCYTFEEALEKLNRYKEVNKDNYLYRMEEIMSLINE